MQRTIYHIPIEPLQERYTAQWYKNFPTEFEAAGFHVHTIDGRPLLDDEIKVGAFLDINSTVHYKMTQLQEISRLFHLGQVPEGSIFFFGDIEFWGMESVRLMARMNNVQVFVTGFLHAASYTKEDAFAIAADFQQYTELGWVMACDKVFVGSHYHKYAFIDRRVTPIVPDLYQQFADKLVVTKNPLFVDEYHKFPDVQKQKKVLLTNRFDREKRPADTLRLFAMLKAVYPDWEFVVTTGRKAIRGHIEDLNLLDELVVQGVVTVKAGLTKEQYHRELAEAYMMVSHSIEENYGYCVAEAIHYQCIPLLTEGLSHNEFVSAGYRFYNKVGCSHLVKGHHVFGYDEAHRLMGRFGQPYPNIDLDTSGMRNIVNELIRL